LPRENLCEIKIITNARENRYIGAKRNGSKGAAVVLIAPDEFAGQMLRFRGTSSVSANQEFVPTGQRFDAPRGRSLEAQLVFAESLKDLYCLTQCTLKFACLQRAVPQLVDLPFLEGLEAARA
jgi:hypothetical protein